MVRNSAKMIAASVLALAMLGTPAVTSAQSYGNPQAAAHCDSTRARHAARRSPAQYAAQRSTVQYEELEQERTKTKSALVIAGAAATGAGVGGALKGGKGALIGAAIGGGAASIYEAAQRR